MRVFHRFSTTHDDLIHDVSYDFYGKRIATCSSDQKIKVWDMNDNGKWEQSAEWKAHCGSVWKVAWTHPEFGQVLASCSFDRTVCIWEEGEDEKGQKKWLLKATLVDSRDSVTDIKFAPKVYGLRLATSSCDGLVRVYEAMDIMNLSQWSLVEDFECQKGVNNSISWNPSSFDKQMIAVGNSDAVIRIWEYNEANRKWHPLDLIHSTLPLLQHSPLQQSQQSQQLQTLQQSQSQQSLLQSSQQQQLLQQQQQQPQLQSSSSQPSLSTQVYQQPSTSIMSSDPAESFKTLHDVCWAPNMGRSFHLIAAASKDHNVRIWKLYQNEKSKMELKEILCNPIHKSEVWRVEWNITGTILASSGDDGNVCLWKSNANGEWKLLSAISGEDNDTK